MEPFDIQPDAFVEKQKEVIAQLTNENILLTCRVEQLERANHELATSISEPMPADMPPPFDPEEAEAAEIAKDDGWDVT